MTPTSVYIRKAAPLLMAALFVCAGSAAAQSKLAVRWEAESYTPLTPDSKPEKIPAHFWAFTEHYHKTGPAKWKALPVSKQHERIAENEQSSASQQAHNKFDILREHLDEAIAKGRQALPLNTERALDIVDKAEKKVAKGVAETDKALGPKYDPDKKGSLADKLAELQKVRSEIKAAIGRQKAEAAQKTGSLKGAKDIEKLGEKDTDEKQKGLSKMYGERGGAETPKGAPGEDGKARVEEDKAAGGQLKGASGAASKYGKTGKEPPKIQQSLFSVARPPDAEKEGIVFKAYAQPSVSAADRKMLAGDFEQLNQLPSGQKVLQHAPGMAPQKDEKGGVIKNYFDRLEEAASGTPNTGYEKPKSGPVYVANKGMPYGASGVTYYDPEGNKTLIALSPELRNADQGVRMAVLTDELAHVEQQQARASRKQAPLMPSVELEKAARLKALQVYGEYYANKTPPRDTELDRKLYDQYQLMRSDRKALLRELDNDYAGNRQTTNSQHLAQAASAEKGKLTNYFSQSSIDRTVQDTDDYYRQVLRDNDEWLRNN